MRIKFIKASYEIDMLGQTGIEKLKHIEKVARLCYKTEDRITDNSYEKLIRHLVKNGHLAMLEHASVAVKFIANRAFTHELVRHRVASFAQESQRYVGYGDCIEFIIPPWASNAILIENEEQDLDGFMIRDLACPEHSWIRSMVNSAKYYRDLLNWGWKPEQARTVLPNAAKTEIWINTNLREWMHVKGLRDHHTASPEMRELMNPLFQDFAYNIPIVFDKEKYE